MVATEQPSISAPPAAPAPMVTDAEDDEDGRKRKSTIDLPKLKADVAAARAQAKEARPAAM